MEQRKACRGCVLKHWRHQLNWLAQVRMASWIVRVIPSQNHTILSPVGRQIILPPSTLQDTVGWVCNYVVNWSWVTREVSGILYFCYLRPFVLTVVHSVSKSFVLAVSICLFMCLFVWWVCEELIQWRRGQHIVCPLSRLTILNKYFWWVGATENLLWVIPLHGASVNYSCHLWMWPPPLYRWSWQVCFYDFGKKESHCMTYSPTHGDIIS